MNQPRQPRGIPAPARSQANQRAEATGALESPEDVAASELGHPWHGEPLTLTVHVDDLGGVEHDDDCKNSSTGNDIRIGELPAELVEAARRLANTWGRLTGPHSAPRPVFVHMTLASLDPDTLPDRPTTRG